MRRWALLTAALAAWPMLAADMSGPYRLGRSRLRIASEAHRVRGYPEEPGPCEFDVNQPVLVGEWEGNVLIGEIQLCEEGEGCGKRSYPFLGFWNEEDRSLTADLELATACNTPALVEGRLVLEPARGAPSPGAEALSTASIRIGPHLEKAQTLLDRDSPGAAKREFQLALDKREDPALANLGLGEVEAKQGSWVKAVSYYKRSIELRPSAVAYYNLACAYGRLRDRRSSIEALRKAVATGFKDASVLERDPDLVPFLRSDPEFQAVVAQVRERAGTAP